MAKMSKEDLLKKIGDLEIDEALKIELLEDVTDSFEFDTSEYDNKYNDLNGKYEELQNKYKERFLKTEDKKEDKKEDDEELKEEDVIDIKEI